MRILVAGILALALVGCGQPSQAPSSEQAAPAAPARVDLLSAHTDENWGVYGGRYAGGKFVLNAGGSIGTQRSNHAVPAGADYVGVMTFVADAPATIRIRLNGGCGATEGDQTIITREVIAGENTFRVQHVFEQPAGCPRLTFIAQTPVSFTLTDAQLLELQ